MYLFFYSFVKESFAMKVRRFFGKDMRQTLTEIAQELGPDAAILSNKRVQGGVEIIAAIDYDEAILDNRAHKKTPDDEINSSGSLEKDISNPSRESSIQKNFKEKKNHQAKANKKPQPDNALTQAVNRIKSQAGISDSVSGKNSPSKKVSLQTEHEYLIEEQPEEKNILPLSEQQFDEIIAEKTTNFKDTEVLSEPFYIDDDIDDATPLNSTIQEEENSKKHYQLNTKAAEPYKQLEWLPDPQIKSMQEELKVLRGLLENQLNGLAWSDTKRKNPLKSLIMTKLIEMGFSNELVDVFSNVASRAGDFNRAWEMTLSSIRNKLKTSNSDKKFNQGVYAFIGPTGVGKTTTIAKLAAQFALENGPEKIAICTADSYRIAAHEQLKIYGKIIGCSTRIINNDDSITRILEQLRDKQLILIDTAGMGQRDRRILEQFQRFKESKYPIHNYLVISATSQRRVLQESLDMFGRYPLHACILTKIDEATSLGEALSMIMHHELEVKFVTDGQRIPDDIRKASSDFLVKEAVELYQQFSEKNISIEHGSLTGMRENYVHSDKSIISNYNDRKNGFC
ncbi:MAG: flagellar biosynthesis protein FlhF [Pseudomonadota bacterium]